MLQGPLETSANLGSFSLTDSDGLVLGRSVGPLCDPFEKDTTRQWGPKSRCCFEPLSFRPLCGREGERDTYSISVYYIFTIYVTMADVQFASLK